MVIFFIDVINVEINNVDVQYIDNTTVLTEEEAAHDESGKKISKIEM